MKQNFSSLLAACALVGALSPVQAANFEWASPTRDATINVAPANNSSVELRGNVTGAVEANESTVVQPSAVIITPRGGELRVETPGGVISHDFGSVLVKTESARFSATLSNVGDKDIAIAFNGYSGDSGVFGFSEDCAATLPPEATCRMEMWFAPEAAVASNASLSLTLDSALTPSYTFTVTGTGVVEGYAWKADSWSVCSNLCGTGTQTRGTWCERSDGLQVDASSCTATTTPDSSQSCTAYTGCTYSWVSTSWGACSVSCGGGTQERTNSCQRSDGAIVADSFCAGAAPATTQACNTQSCSVPVTYSWKTGDWNSCANTCGSRTVWCESSAGGTVADFNCNAATQPSSSGSCPASCKAWITGAWSACSSATCGVDGIQTRTVYCADMSGSAPVAVADSECTGVKPATSQPCTGVCAPTANWRTGAWSSCSVTCGSGTMTRSVWCESGGVVVANSMCSGAMPASSAACTGTCASYSWVTGNWGSCTGGSCGTGTQSRSVTCQSSTGAVVNNSNCSGPAPVSSQSCSLGACATFTYRWVGGAYSACPSPSTICPVSDSVQSQTCMRSDNVVVADSYCIGVGLTKPVVTTPCLCAKTTACSAGQTVQATYSYWDYMGGGTIPVRATMRMPAAPNGYRFDGIRQPDSSSYSVISWEHRAYICTAWSATVGCQSGYFSGWQSGIGANCGFSGSNFGQPFNPNVTQFEATCVNGVWQVTDFQMIATCNPEGV